MPDKAKLAKAVEIGLRSSQCCGSCAHSVFLRNVPVGHCKLHSYLHQKHDGRRQMPAFRFFVCNDFEMDDEKMRNEVGWYAGQEWRR